MREQTNLYARQKLATLRAQNKLGPNSRFKQWRTLTIAETKTFLAIILHKSIIERPSMASHWCSDPVVSCNFCPNVMPRDRFLNIFSMFHINDNSKQKKKGEIDFDALHKVRPLLDDLVRNFKDSYQPGEALTIDEGMCPFRGRVGFKVYMVNKTNKYGIKLYIVAESKTGYIYNFEVYHGRDDKLDNSASAVVKRLLGSLQGKSHTVYGDRFYTSVQLAEELARANTGLVGTVMPNRKGLPKALKEGKLKKGGQIFRRKNDVLALRWKDKRNVWMISTRHTSSMLPVATREGNEKLKPVAVLDYNKHKAGVDLFDQRLSYGALDHKTVKWWRKLAFHCIIMAVSNGCILVNSINEKKLSTPKFIQEVCNALVLQRGERIEDSHGSATIARLSQKHFPNREEMAEGKKKAQIRCVVCSGKQKNITGKAGRKDTFYECSECNNKFPNLLLQSDRVHKSQTTKIKMHYEYSTLYVACNVSGINILSNIKK
ncbi:piggyBac transposable element-derived protein 4-like [Schistocerca americana]|uniref:piggyBac transposable element-derived protein 4-like n=1 Tax=Schistocerca americana TaxID=7009 RepID=UPI001F4F4F9A|nr:piggyBac transposable element-derived protein 4-like [Schistocerca americana]